MTLLFQIISTAFMVASAYFWIRGNLWMSLETILQLSATKWGSNIDLAQSLISQRCDSVIAFTFLLIGFLIQIWSSYIPDKPCPFIKSWFYGIVFFLSLWFVIFTIGNCIARTMEKVELEKIKIIREQKESAKSQIPSSEK
ncbi:MAG: hypothetical protein PHV97_03600 [Candidatus Omnitrophica bacterium]|nr:hypothetical protein [Candidatus Omnitrophota bacterium]